MQAGVYGDGLCGKLCIVARAAALQQGRVALVWGRAEAVFDDPNWRFACVWSTMPMVVGISSGTMPGMVGDRRRPLTASPMRVFGGVLGWV